MKLRLSTALLAASMTGALSCVNAAVMVDDVKLVAKLPQYEQVAPQPKSFVVTSIGRYAVTVSDVGFPVGSSLMSVDLIITKGTQTIARISRLGTLEFDAAPGTYTVHVLGGGAPAGLATVGVSVTPVGGGLPLLQYQAGISSSPIPAPSNRSSLAARFSVTTAGTYQVALNDRGFPVALSSVDLLIVSAAGAPVARLCQPAIASVCGNAPLSFPATVGDYDLFVNAAAASPLQAGLYSINVTGGPANAVLYAATHPVGVLESHAFIEFPTAGSYSLTLNDLQFPAALSSVRAVIAQGSEVLTNVSGATTQSFAATQGRAALYTMALPTGGQGVGTFGVHVPNGAQTLYSDAQAVVGASADGVRAYVFVGNFPSDGNYRIQARDFGFPTTIPALQVIATQDGARLGLGAVSAGGSLTVPAKAGPFLILAIANVISPTATGLFGISIDAQPSGVEVLTVTQGIGDIFHNRSLTTTNSGLLNVTLRDMGFPMPFDDLALVVTRGNSMVGQIFGGGTFSFPATPGTYSLNFIARSRPVDQYGLYGLMVEDSLPKITFSAGAQSVPMQGSTTVSWSASAATSCVASDGWSGARPVTGTNVSVGPFAANTKLTLTCNGPGGTDTASVSIAVAAVGNNDIRNGAGSFAIWQLLAALALCMRVSIRGVR